MLIHIFITTFTLTMQVTSGGAPAQCSRTSGTFNYRHCFILCYNDAFAFVRVTFVALIGKQHSEQFGTVITFCHARREWVRVNVQCFLPLNRSKSLDRSRKDAHIVTGILLKQC